MLFADAIRKRIKYFLKLNKTNLWGLYKSTGITMSTLSSFMRGDKKILIQKTLLHICEGLDTNLQDFFNDKIFADVEDCSEDKNER